MQSTLGGFVKQQVTIERHEGWHTYDTIHIEVGVDWVHLENKKVFVTNLIIQCCWEQGLLKSPAYSKQMIVVVDKYTLNRLLLQFKCNFLF